MVREVEGEEARDGDEEMVIAVEEVIVLDEGTSRVGEEEVIVEEGGWDVVEGKVVVDVAR